MGSQNISKNYALHFMGSKTACKALFTIWICISSAAKHHSLVKTLNLSLCPPVVTEGCQLDAQYVYPSGT